MQLVGVARALKMLNSSEPSVASCFMLIFIIASIFSSVFPVFAPLTSHETFH